MGLPNPGSIVGTILNSTGQGGPQNTATGQQMNQYTSGNSLTATGQSGTSQSSGLNENQYTAPQQALQGQTSGTISGLLNGSQQPMAAGFSPAVWQAMLMNFNQDVAPKIAAQYGAGSPQVGGQLADLLLKATAQSSQQQWNNEQNLLGDAQSNAFTPVGNATGSAQTTGQTGSAYDSYQENTTPGGALLSTLANSAGGALSSAAKPPTLPSITLPGGQPGATLP